MPGLKSFANMWRNIGEIDLRPIRKAAEKQIVITISAGPEARSQMLIDQLHRDPKRLDVLTDTPVFVTSLDLQPVYDTTSLKPVPVPQGTDRSVEVIQKPVPNNALEIPKSEGDSLVIILLNAAAGEVQQAEELAHRLTGWRKKFLVLVDGIEQSGAGQVQAGLGDWRGARVLYGSADDPAFLQKSFVPAVLDQLADDHLALGRLFPLFRLEIARRLINETCVSNAAYAFSTGLAEIVPVLDVPLNVTDMVVLTKAQAFLVYKLGLVFGFTTHWQDYIAEFSSIIGGGFMWRQIARQLVGLIPIWGIVPKVAVAYSGTYVVGNAVMQWYLTGRKVTRAQVSGLYKQAIERGRAFAKELVRKSPQKRLSKKEQKQLAAQKKAEPAVDLVACSNCGATNPVEAKECRACGAPL